MEMNCKYIFIQIMKPLQNSTFQLNLLAQDDD